MTASIPLDIYATVTLNGAGNGTAQAGPSIVREHWQVDSVTVSVATQAKTASCSIYIGTTVFNGQLISNTLFGSQGQACGLGGRDIPSGYQIFAVWAGGDAGQVATAHITGTRSVGAAR